MLAMLLTATPAGASLDEASALAAYVRVRERLVEDLGVSPTAETEAVHDGIVLTADVVTDVAATPRTALPGRATELAALDAALERSAAGAMPSMVAVVGEAGIGKTALLEHWCAGLGLRALTLVGRCDPLGRDLPLQPIADALAAHLATLDEQARRDALGEDDAVLAPLLGLGTGAATTVADPELGRARLFAAILAVLGRLAGTRVVVLVIDDLHLAGESTLAWLRFAVHRPGRLLVLVASRGGDAHADATTLILGPLDERATAEVVGADRAAALHARSGGHPMLLAALADSDGEALPATVHDAVQRRVDALGDVAMTVRTAALLGASVDLDLVADVLRVPAVDVLGHLEAGAAAGLLVERGAGFAFRHELERESIEQGASATRRALVHRDAARALAARDRPDPLVVAVHARLGGDIELAADWLTRAAQVAIARTDVDAAERHLDDALALTTSPATLVTRARLRMATGRLEEAAEDAARAVADSGAVDALEVAGWVAYYRRRYDEALAFAEEAIERTADPALRTSCLALAGRVRHGAGNVIEAVHHFERAVDADAPAGVRALAAIWLAQARAHQGRPDQALALVERALVDPDRIAHPFAPLHGWFIRVMAMGQLGRARDALDACDQLDAEVARRGEFGVRMTAPAANVRAWVLRFHGRMAEADDLNLAAVASTDPTGVRAEAYFAGLLDLADGRLQRDDDGGAAELLEPLATIEQWNGTMAWHQRHRWNLLRARLALRDGDVATAAELSHAVAEDATARGTRRYELLARGVHVLAGGDDADVSAIVAGLRTCAAIDGAPLIDALTARGR